MEPRGTIDIEFAYGQEDPSALVALPFGKGLEVLAGIGYTPISLAQGAQLRIKYGSSDLVSRNGYFTREGFIYTPGEKTRIVRESPILSLESAKLATESHQRGEEFYITDGQRELALLDSYEIQEEDMKARPASLGSEPLFNWLLGGEKAAETYGEFLVEHGIKWMQIISMANHTVNSNSRPFVRQLLVNSMSKASAIGGHGSLSSTEKICGVKTV